MSEEVTPNVQEQPPATVATKAPKVEKVKEPAVEDLPFEQFVSEQYLPALAAAFQKQGIVDLQLKFENFQVQGKWNQNYRQFTVYFSKQDISAQKAFSCADGGLSPSTIEPFLIDERKGTLDLLVFGVMQRLNAQKWLAPN
jgi:hypothetical protein